MKKIQVALAILAVVLASAGVFASKMSALAITYHINDNAQTSTPCDTQVTPSCQQGDQEFCTSWTTGSGQQVYKKNGTVCTELMRPL